MIGRLGLILLLFGLFGDTAADRGRTGNARFRAGDYAAAAEAYRRGLSLLDDTTGAVYSRLQNNLGMALQRQQKYASAQTAFERAYRSATSEADRTRSLFNRANVAAALGDRNRALSDYKQVLLSDPEHEAARFNYEYLKRRTGDEPSAEPPRVEPSRYAQRLRREAEGLVANMEYTAAAALMKDGVQRDSTVMAYRDFIRRIEEIARINRSTP